MRIIKFLGWGVVVFALALVCFWAGGALYYHPPFGVKGALWLTLVVASAIALLVGFWLGRRAHKGKIVLALATPLVLSLGLAGWVWSSLVPNAAGPYRPELARQATAAVDGDRVEIQNVRNFFWRNEEREDFDERWETRVYSLAALRSLDLINTYWSGPDIAHTMVSFGFEDGRQLAVSVEVRRKIGEVYDPISGFFKNFDLIVLPADERDLVGLRHIRPEDSYLYRLNFPPKTVRALFLEYLRHMNELAQKPEFYETLTHSCATEIFRMAKAADLPAPLNWRAILNGHVPQLAYDRGELNKNFSFDALRIRARVQTHYHDTPDSIAYSKMLRAGVPSPTDTPQTVGDAVPSDPPPGLPDTFHLTK